MRLKAAARPQAAKRPKAAVRPQAGPHLEAPAALRQVGVAVHPVQAVHVHRMARQDLAGRRCPT